MAALVFKKLDETDTVIHDLRLRGESGINSQIDIIINSDGGRRRTLIECKDFDVSGDDVGIDVVRCFWAVVEDLRPDNSIILTCNGFTRDAKIYAKHKGIRLALLRKFLEADGHELIKDFNITIKILEWINPKPQMYFHNKEHFDKWNNDQDASEIRPEDILKGAKPIYSYTSEGRSQTNEYLDKLLNKYHEAVGKVYNNLHFFLMLVPD